MKLSHLFQYAFLAIILIGTATATDKTKIEESQNGEPLPKQQTFKCPSVDELKECANKVLNQSRVPDDYSQKPRKKRAVNEYGTEYLVDEPVTPFKFTLGEIMYEATTAATAPNTLHIIQAMSSISQFHSTYISYNQDGSVKEMKFQYSPTTSFYSCINICVAFKGMGYLSPRLTCNDTLIISSPLYHFTSLSDVEFTMKEGMGNKISGGQS